MTCVNRTLQQGNTGEDVKILQARLSLIRDGSFGPVTKSNVITYQTNNGLYKDGIAGPITLTHMNIYCSDWKLAPGYKIDIQDTDYTCGPTSLSMALTELFHNRGTTEAEMAGHAGTTSSGTTHDGMRTAFLSELEEHGYTGLYAEQSLTDITMVELGELCEDPDYFVICHGMTGGWPTYWLNNYGHYVYLVGVKPSTGQYKVADPTKGVCTYSRVEFETGLNMITQKSFLIFKVNR